MDRPQLFIDKWQITLHAFKQWVKYATKRLNWSWNGRCMQQIFDCYRIVSVLVNFWNCSLSPFTSATLGTPLTKSILKGCSEWIMNELHRLCPWVEDPYYLGVLCRSFPSTHAVACCCFVHICCTGFLIHQVHSLVTFGDADLVDPGDNSASVTFPEVLALLQKVVTYQFLQILGHKFCVI